MTSARFVRVTLSLAIAAGLAACGEKNEYAAPPPPKVTVAAPLEQDVTPYYDETGNAASVNSVDLVARVQGFVQAISYTDGQFVKKGTSLFTIEPEPYRLKVDVGQGRRHQRAGHSGAEAAGFCAPSRSPAEAGLRPSEL